ncbi:MAG: hypothetical protein A2285_09405 [Elusimicrobia bacterium RIFOXYA12_FULL_57_11]|nr:MAG: hypothetical protein A2285_09405 [Elusimicrobia bacterium RIFOXYA12_FULL_57_11]
MNLIYIRPKASKARRFINKKLRRSEAASIYDIEAGDCCLAPAPVKKNGYMLTFLNDVSPEMLSFIYQSGTCAGKNNN